MTLPIKPNIYDNTHFDLEIVSPITTPLNPIGIATGFTNPIYGVNWALTGVHTTGAGVAYTMTTNGQHYLSPPDSGNYVEYDKVSRDTVKSWIDGTEANIVRKYTICNNIQELIDKKAITENQSLPSSW